MKAKSIINFLTFLLIITHTGCFAKDKANKAFEPVSNAETSENVANYNYPGSSSGNFDNSLKTNLQSDRYGETPEDSILCVRNLSLYTEFYRQSNFKNAYGPWQKALEICPKASQNLYIHGAALLKHRHNKETDPIKRDALVDSLMWLYDKRIKHFGREGFVLGRKGVDMFMLRPEKTKEIFDLTNTSIESEEHQSRADVLVVNMQTGVSLAQAGIKDEIDVFNIYERAIDIIDYNLKHSPEDAEIFERTKSQVESLFRPYFTCDVLVKVFEPRFEDDPECPDLLTQITTMLDEADGTDRELFYKATRNLHQVQPTASSAFLMGRLESNQNNYRNAVDYFNEAIALYKEKENVDQELYRVYMLKSEIEYRQLRRYVQARNSAREAAKIKPDNGRPYILIGEMYATTAKDCGDDDFTERVAYWAAVDKFIQAQNIDSDPDIVERANQLINAYSQYFPDKETIFFHGYEEGDTYLVECWINKTTRVRAR